MTLPMEPRRRFMVILAALGTLLLAGGCDDTTAPASDGLGYPVGLPQVVHRDPAELMRTDGDAQLGFEISAATAHPGEAVQFDAQVQNLMSETLEYYGLVCWLDSPRFFLIDGEGTVYRIEWRPVPPCPSTIKHLASGKAVVSRDWFSGFALLDGDPVDLPFGDYTARAEFVYRPMSLPVGESRSISTETGFRWEAAPQ